MSLGVSEFVSVCVCVCVCACVCVRVCVVVNGFPVLGVSLIDVWAEALVLWSRGRHRHGAAVLCWGLYGNRAARVTHIAHKPLTGWSVSPPYSSPLQTIDQLTCLHNGPGAGRWRRRRLVFRLAELIFCAHLHDCHFCLSSVPAGRAMAVKHNTALSSHLGPLDVVLVEVVERRLRKF